MAVQRIDPYDALGTHLPCRRGDLNLGLFRRAGRGLSWTWGLGCLALWIVAFPWYLVERNKAQPLPVGARPGEWLPDPVDPERLERRKEDGRWTRDVRARRVLPAGAEEGGHQ